MSSPAFWSGRRVLLTGHTGFKGAWLALWLDRLGADVTGFANGVPTRPALWELAPAAIRAVEGDIRDLGALEAAMAEARPQVVLHLAAQPLVRRGLADPVETYETNVMGTVNVLEAVRRAEGVEVVVNVTSDKCYENVERAEVAYREEDELGGKDPYSSSKGAAELVAAAYRRSYWDGVPGAPRLASVRAGNVIGGADYGAERLMPDVARAFAAGEPVVVRNPRAVRPRQHVLNPLSGYLLVAERLAAGEAEPGAWNFGPEADDARPVAEVVERMAALWGGVPAPGWVQDERDQPAEAQLLRLDSTKAARTLGWRPRWGLEEALRRTVELERALAAGEDVRPLVLRQIEEFEAAPVAAGAY